MGQLAQVEWRPVSGYESLYEISDDGRVRSLDRKEPCNGGIRHRRGCELALLHKQTGYVYVNLYKNSHMKTHSVHRLVAIAFIPKPLGKREVNHINGDKTDNRVENLEWVSESENIRHSFKVLGKKPNTGNAKLTSEQVLAIRAMDGTQAEIAAQFGVSRSAIGLIKQGKTYKEVS